MLNTLNTSENLMLKSNSKDTLNKIKLLLKVLKLCDEIQVSLLIRMIEIIINSNTVSR